MATLKDQKSRHANTAKLMIGTVEVGEVISLSVQEDTGADPVQIVGSPYAQEHNHNRVTVSVSFQRVIFKKSALAKYNVGGTNILTLPPFDVHAYDKQDGGALLFKVKDVTLTSRDLSVQANQRMMSNLRGMGIMLVSTDGQGKVLADTGSDGANYTADAGTPGDLTTPGGNIGNLA